MVIIMKGNKIFIVKDVFRNNGRFRSKYIIMRDTHNSLPIFYFAEFDSKEQFDTFLNTLNIDYEIDEIHNQDTQDEIIVGHLTYKIESPFSAGFWDLNQLPQSRSLIKALSGGSIVDCYFSKDDKKKVIVWYRPNPNAKNVYVPLDAEKHIAHQKIYGCY